MRTLARPADEKDPQYLHPRAFDSFRDASDLLRVEALVEPRQHGIARALGGDAQPPEPRRPHRGEELRRRRRWRKVRRVEVQPKSSTHDGFADGGRVSRRGVERGIDELETPDAALACEGCHFICYRVRIPQAVTPSLDIEIGAIHALEHASALCLNRNGRAPSLIRAYVDPVLEAHLGQRVETCLPAGRNQSRALAVAPDEP